MSQGLVLLIQLQKQIRSAQAMNFSHGLIELFTLNLY